MLYASREGTATTLSALVGRNEHFIAKQREHGRLTPELAVELESLLGRDKFPRELFRPDIFLIEKV